MGWRGQWKHQLNSVIAADATSGSMGHRIRVRRRELGKKMLHGEWGYLWLGNMVDQDKLAGNGTWGSNRDINIFTVNLNVGVLRCVSGVG